SHRVVRIEHVIECRPMHIDLITLRNAQPWRTARGRRRRMLLRQGFEQLAIARHRHLSKQIGRINRITKQIAPQLSNRVKWERFTGSEGERGEDALASRGMAANSVRASTLRDGRSLVRAASSG